MPDIKLTKIIQSDFSAIQQLAHKVWHAHYPGIISQRQIDHMLNMQYSQDSMNKDLASNVTMVKLNVDETLAGFATFGRDKSDQVRAVKLHKLYLLQSFHGQGLGSMFLQHVENESRNQGFEWIKLNVNKHNRGAVKTYRRNGYRNEKSVLEPIGLGFYVDDFVMVKKL
jgi:diamine N-acetyltransferase